MGTNYSREPGVFSLSEERILLFSVAVIFLSSSLACIKRQREQNLSFRTDTVNTSSSQIDQTKANDQQSTSSFVTLNSNQAAKRININAASAEELEKLPGIGKALAGRIIEHREKYGRFRRAEHLIIVRGISDRKFRALRDLITVE